MFSDMELGTKIFLIVVLVAIVWGAKGHILSDKGKGNSGKSSGGSSSSGGEQ